MTFTIDCVLSATHRQRAERYDLRGVVTVLVAVAVTHIITTTARGGNRQGRRVVGTGSSSCRVRAAVRTSVRMVVLVAVLMGVLVASVAVLVAVSTTSPSLGELSSGFVAFHIGIESGGGGHTGEHDLLFLN